MIALLKRQLGAYRTVLWFVVLYQAIQAIAGLYLPTLNADIIDKGVAKGDHGYILRMGVVMIGVTLIQVFTSASEISTIGSGRSLCGGEKTQVEIW